MSDTDIVASKKGPIKENTLDSTFDERTIQIDRVTRVVKGGRRFRFRALVVVGDKHQHMVGIGSARGADVTAAVKKATNEAKKNMIKVPIYKETIPHDVTVKFSASKIFMRPAKQGTGLIAGGVVRTILEVSGINNILSKSYGSSNKINVAHATIKALQELTPSKEWTTRQNEVDKEKSVKIKDKI